MNPLEKTEKELTSLIGKLFIASSSLENAVAAVKKANVSFKKLAVDVHESTTEKINDSEMKTAEFRGSKQEIAVRNDCNERVTVSSGIPERQGNASGKDLQEICTTLLRDTQEDSTVAESGVEDSKILEGKAIAQEDDQINLIGSQAELKSISRESDQFIGGKVVGSLGKHSTFWFLPSTTTDEDVSLERFPIWQRMHVRDLKRKEDLKIGDMVAFHSQNSSSWVRGVVEKTNMNKSNEVRLRCIDDGSTADLHSEYIYEIPIELESEPKKAMYCCLFKDICEYIEDGMPYEAKWLFKDIVTDKAMKIRILEKCVIDGSKTDVVDLYTDDETSDLNTEMHLKVKDEWAARQEKRSFLESSVAEIPKEEKPVAKSYPKVNDPTTFSKRVKRKEPGDNAVVMAEFKDSTRREKGLIRLEPHAIEIGRLHAILIKPDPQFVVAHSSMRCLPDSIRNGYYRLRSAPCRELQDNNKSLVRKPTYLFVVNVNRKISSSKSICAVGYIKTDPYRQYSQYLNCFIDKVDVEYLCSAKLLTTYTGPLVDFKQLSRKQGVKVIEEIIQKLSRRKVESITGIDARNNRTHQHAEEITDQRLMPTHPMQNNFVTPPRFQQNYDKPSKYFHPEGSFQFGFPYSMPFAEATEDNWDIIDPELCELVPPQIKKQGSEGKTSNCDANVSSVGISVENLASTLKDDAATTNTSKRSTVSRSTRPDASCACPVTSAKLQESPSSGELPGNTGKCHVVNDESMERMDKGEAAEEQERHTKINLEHRTMGESQVTIRRKHPNDEAISIAAARDEQQSESPDMADQRTDEASMNDVRDAGFVEKIEGLFDANDQQGEATKLARSLLKGIRRGYANELVESCRPEGGGLDLSWINADDSLPRDSNVDLEITEDGYSSIPCNDAGCSESLAIGKETNIIEDEKVFYENEDNICFKVSAFVSSSGTHCGKEAQEHLQSANDIISSVKSASAQDLQSKVLAKQKKPDQRIYQPKARSSSGDMGNAGSGDELQNKDTNVHERNGVGTSTNVRDMKSKTTVAEKKCRKNKKNIRKQKEIYRSNPELNLMSPVRQTKDGCAKYCNQCSPITTDSSNDCSINWDKINSE